MDERKSVLTNNQAIENIEQDFPFANGETENAVDATIKPYSRDILLQLRLHPLSLQKPRELPEMEVIKDKLYLNDITDMTPTSPEKNTDTSNYPSSGKRDYCNMKPEYSMSPYFNRIYPYCYSPHPYNGFYQSAPLKHRSSYNTYCNSLKKHRMSSHQCLKDFPLEECPWAKHFASSDDMWNCYSNHGNSGIYKRKEHLEAVPKSRKKLPIIDPATGKNVLETVQSSQPEQNNSSSIEKDSNAVENDVTIKQFCGDYFCNTKENHEAATYKSNEVYDSESFSSGDKTSFDELKDPSIQFQTDVNEKLIECNLEETNNTIPSTVDSSKEVESEDQKDGNVESSGAKNSVFDFIGTSEKPHTCNAFKYNKQIPKISCNREMSSYADLHGTCRTNPIKDYHMHFCNENISKQNDTMQENLRQLREKIYSLKQEEQKVAILQSFLRYKKYQLEESARNLDEKRIEIANWEYNLYNKAKILQEKEQCLESRNEILKNKTQQLAKKEKMLNEDEDKISDNTLYSNKLVETGIPEKKFSFEKNAVWNEITKMKNPRVDESNEYSFVRYDSKSAKVPETISPNVEKCKSDAFSLDELEKNLVFIEKMHSSNDIKESTVNEIELASSSNTMQKSEENASYEPLGYSKGRRYLPEHIKYWLDKRDKNAL